QGGRLGPDSCGWHYVAGLTQNDDRRLAILWDKVGLGHFGENWGGAREVVFVGRNLQVIQGADWPRFLEEQQQLLAQRDELAIRGGPVLVATVKLPTGKLVDQLDNPFEMEEEYVSPTTSTKGKARSGSALQPSDLKWKGVDLVPTELGTKTWILSFPEKKLRSKPVKVKVENGRATPRAIVFDMEVMQQP
ncbi:MAG: hypothetical protein JO112_03350, partial [Planctomycetes bacterium]|nr:hypothetical protein [Planctomycetota bacterium]